MKEPKIGIVTVLYKSAEVLEKFFECLDVQTYKNFVLYIIDNNSPDNSVELCKKYTKDAWYETKIFDAGENGGIARGNNIGIEFALADKCDYILLSNSDIEFSPNAIEDTLKSMNEHNADIVVPKIFNYFTGNISYAGGGFDSWTFACSIDGTGEKDQPKFNKGRFVDFGSTCFMLVKSEVFDKTGLMDERYFVYYDDTDFVWRAVMMDGFKMYYEPKVEIFHKAGSSHGSTLNKFALTMEFRNMAYFMNKYFKWYKRWSITAWMLFYHMLKVMRHPRYAKCGNPLSYYLNGIKLYNEWKKHGNLKKECHAKQI